MTIGIKTEEGCKCGSRYLEFGGGVFIFLNIVIYENLNSNTNLY